MNDEKHPPSLDELNKQIEKARKDSQVLENQDEGEKEQNKVALAMRLGVEMVSGTAVGMFVGYHLDGWLGTKPIFFILLFFVGFAAGMLNTFRYVLGKGKKTKRDD